MRSQLVVVSALLASLLAPVGPAKAASQAPAKAAPRSGTYVPGEVLVKFKPGATAGSRRNALAARGHALVGDLHEPGWAQLRLGDSQNVTDAVAAYRADPSVEYAQPNFLYRALRAPDDPLHGQVWGLRNTGQTVTAEHTQPPGTPLQYDVRYPGSNPGTAGSDAQLEPAWNVITDCSSVVVAVVDTGVNYLHEDLASNMWTAPGYPNHGYDFVDFDYDPMDLAGHGTHVAGTIGAVGDNGKGIAGVCWKASIMAVRVLNAMGGGTTAQIVAGIGFAADHGAKVINMSLGGDGGFDQLYSDAIASARARDVVFVVAAGNDAEDNDRVPVWPCNFDQPNLVCVAALDQKYELAAFSNHGATTVALGAPGTNTVSTWPGTSGSIADPLTSGWTFTSTTAGGWSYLALTTASGASLQCLADPGTYPAGLYQASTDDRAYKLFALDGADVALLKLSAAADVSPGDHFRIAYQAATSTSDPFVVGRVLEEATDAATYPNMFPLEYELPNCRRSGCSIGFQLESGSGGAARGVALAHFAIDTLTLNGSSYDTLNGTSMATPMVAGVVTLLRAHNPRYTYSDVVTAITESGRPLASLAGKTRSGKAIDAVQALAYIQAPTGLSATVK